MSGATAQVPADSVATVAREMATGISASALGSAVSGINAYVRQIGEDFVDAVFEANGVGGYQSWKSQSAAVCCQGLTGAQTNVKYVPEDARFKSYYDSFADAYKRMTDLRCTLDPACIVGDAGNPAIVNRMTIRLTFPVHIDVTRTTQSTGVFHGFLDHEEAEENSCWFCDKITAASRDISYRALSKVRDPLVVVSVDFAYDQELYQRILSCFSPVTASSGRTPGHFLTKAQMELNTWVLDKCTASDFLSGHHRYMTVMTKLLGLCIVCDSFRKGRFVTVMQTGDLDSPSTIRWGEPETVINYAYEQFQTLSELLPFLQQQGGAPGIVATEITGSFYDDDVVKVIVDEDALLEHHHKTITNESERPTSIMAGANIFGAPPLNDHKHPLTFVSAMSRHLAVAEAKLQDVEGMTVTEAYLDRSQMVKPTKAYYELMVASKQHFAKQFAIHKDSMDLNPGEVMEMKPSSIGWERVDQVFDEYMSSCHDMALYAPGNTSTENDKRTHFFKHVKAAISATVFCKSGEDSDRGRFISMPGSNAVDAQVHQVCTSRTVKAIEAVMQRCTNHTSIKGLTPDGVTLSLGEFLLQTPRDHCVTSWDKKSNDRTYNPYHLEAQIDWMLEAKDTMCRAWGVSAEESELAFLHYRSDTFKTIINATFFRVIVSELAHYLQSAINPTSWFNRHQGAIESMERCYSIHGKDAAMATMYFYYNGLPSDVAYLSDWKPHDSKTIKLRWPIPLDGEEQDPAFESLSDEGKRHYKAYKWRLKNEGDDLIESIKLAKGYDTPNKLVTRSIQYAEESQRLLLEIAPGIPQDRMMGKIAVANFCSSYYAADTNSTVEAPVVVRIPNPKKAIRKMAYVHTDTVKIVETEGIQVAVHTPLSRRFCATRCLAIAEHNLDSPVVFQFMMMHYHMHSRMLATSALTYFDQRSMESRGIEDAAHAHWVNERLDEWANVLLAKYEQRRNDAQIFMQQTHLQAFAWVGEFPHLKQSSPARIVDDLWTLELGCQDIELTQELCNDPLSLLQMLDSPLIFKCVWKLNSALISRLIKHNKAVKDLLWSENPLEHFKQLLNASNAKVNRRMKNLEVTPDAQPKLGRLDATAEEKQEDGSSEQLQETTGTGDQLYEPAHPSAASTTQTRASADSAEANATQGSVALAPSSETRSTSQKRAAVLAKKGKNGGRK